MCNHHFCSSVKVGILRERITSKKLCVWLYTFKKNTLQFCLIKEKFRNYDLISGYIKDIDEECYEKALFRILNNNFIDITPKQFKEIFYFLGVPLIKNHNGIPVFIGLYKNIPISIIKRKIKNSTTIYDDFEYSNLHGEIGEWRVTSKRKALTETSKNVLNKSIDEDWINIYKLNFYKNI